MYEKNKIKISSDFIRYFDYESIKSKSFRCARCKENFLRGIFLALGAVNDPEKSYRLELIFNEEGRAKEIKDALLEIGIEPLVTTRNNKHLIYLRKIKLQHQF